jgi:MscS family membrane protein
MGKRRITFNLGVTYTTPIDKIKICVERIRMMLENHTDLHQETIFVRFDKFSESSLDIFLYFFTNTTKWSEYLKVKEDVNFKIMEILEQEGVSVAFPSRSIYLEKTETSA